MGNGQPGHVINYEHSWVHSSPHSPIPPNAIVGGHDSDGSVIYVGRSFHEGDHLPAKVVPSKGQAYVAWGGNEVNVHHYEILCGHNYNWIPCAMGRVPLNAVRTGTTSTGEPLYVGRGHHCGSLTVGKIHPTHHCLYIPFGGQEHRLDTYEVLVQDRGLLPFLIKPEPSAPCPMPTPMPTPTPPPVIPYPPIQAPIYPPIIQAPIYPPPIQAPIYPPPIQAPIYPGTTDHMWVHSSPYATIPPNAVHGGYDVDGTPIYIGRSYHEGDLLPAKVIPSKNTAFVSWSGQEYSKSHYEILCGYGYSWRPCHGGIVPPNAVRCGNASNEPLFIGRGQCEGSLTVGKIHPSHRCLYIPFGGIERRLDHYEVLVQEATDIWIPCTDNRIPPNAVHAGTDSDLSSIYVGRAYHEGDLLPAKVVPTKGFAYVCFGGQEIIKHTYEILTGTYQWIPSQGGQIPPGAVSGGRNSAGETLYIGRGPYSGTMTPGKIQPSHHCLYIPFGGREVRIDNYEILIRPHNPLLPFY